MGLSWDPTYGLELPCSSNQTPIASFQSSTSRGTRKNLALILMRRRTLKLVCLDICDCKQRYNGGSSAYLVQSSRHCLPQPCQLNDEGPIYTLGLVSMGSFRPLRQIQRAALIACTIKHLPSLPFLSFPFFLLSCFTLEPHAAGQAERLIPLSSSIIDPCDLHTKLFRQIIPITLLRPGAAVLDGSAIKLHK
jgi:hypothetical protein